MPSRNSMRTLVLALAFIAGALSPALAGPGMQYGFQAGKQYPYTVKIQANLNDSEEIHEGVLVYAADSNNGKQIVLKPSGMLRTRSQARPGRRPIGGRPSGPPFGARPPGPPQFTKPGPTGVTINYQGEILIMSSSKQLPFMLGHQEVFLLEPLPADGKDSWEKSRDLVILERKEQNGPPSHLRFGRVPEADGVKRPAKELVEYRIADTTGARVKVTKKYDLRTQELSANGSPRMEQVGTGTFTFDAKAGLIQSLDMKYEIHLNDKNVSITLPVTVSYRLLTEAEWAAIKITEDQERAKSAAAVAKAKEPKPFQEGERAKLLDDLQALDPGRKRAAADRLAQAPADAEAAEIAKALALLLMEGDDWGKGAAAKALKVWATPEVGDQLIQASTSENMWVRTAATEALGKVKSAKAAAAAAAQMYRSRTEASIALKAMGPVAEPAVIGLLKDRDGWVRKEACLILAEIGGEKSCTALREYGRRATGPDLQDANNAFQAIKGRLATAAKSKK